MAIAKQVLSIKASLAFASLSTLISANYVRNTTAYDCSVNQPQDVLIEINAATTNAPAGNKQLMVFIQESIDGTVFRSGPISGADRTREGLLRPLGVLPLPMTATTETAILSVQNILGFVPQKFYIVIYNDTGVALTSATVNTSEVSYL